MIDTFANRPEHLPLLDFARVKADCDAAKARIGLLGDPLLRFELGPALYKELLRRLTHTTFDVPLVLRWDIPLDSVIAVFKSEDGEYSRRLRVVTEGSGVAA